jgi:hypothetical protein
MVDQQPKKYLPSTTIGKKKVWKIFLKKKKIATVRYHYINENSN